MFDRRLNPWFFFFSLREEAHLPSIRDDSRKFGILITVLGALTAFGPLSIDMYLPALPRIARDFAVPLSTVQLSLTSFFIGLAFGQVFYGPLADRFGRKLPLYIGLSIYTVASLVCAVSSNSDNLIAARFFQAIGSCSGMVASRAVVRDLFDEKDSAKVFSLLMLVMGAAPILAPLIGGYVSEAFGWRVLFVILAALSTMSLIAVRFLLPETKKANPEAKLLKALSTYLSIAKDGRFVGYAVAGGAAQAGMFAYITGSPFVFINLFGIAPENYGWIFGSNALALIAASQLNVRLLKRSSPERILALAFPILALAGLGLLVSSVFDLGFVPVVASLFIYVGFLGITFPNTTAAALVHEGRRAGSASALLGTIQFILAALASAAVSFFHDGTSVSMAIVIAGCGLLALIIDQTKLRSLRSQAL